jgi:CDP-glycerol glycerophosphotransferase (TagB/SpsB family)
MTSRAAEAMVHTDVFLQTEIYGRGPSNALRIFIGHGQPNKWTNWSEENLKAFDLYFLYGELERSMFEVIMESRPESTRHIKLFNIGYPKLDDQIQGKYSREEVLESIGLDPKRKTVIYAPAWDPGGALRTLGVLVPQLLLKTADINVITKLHPASLEPSYSPNYAFYTGGVDWLSAFQALEANPRFKYVHDFLINPLLFASDAMVTDFSGVALEFMTLDRPVVYLHCPQFYQKTLVEWGNDPEVSLNDERFNAGRNAGIVVHRPEELVDAVRRCLTNPGEHCEKRRRLVSKFLYNPGFGSRATVDKIMELLDIRDVVLAKAGVAA